MKQKLHFKSWLLMLCMLLGVGNAWATDPDEEVDFSAQGYTNQQAITSYSGTDFTVSFNKGTNNNAPKYYTSGTAIRAYGGNYFTVSSTTKTIEKIVITFGSSDGSNAITTDEDSYENGTWEGSASSVTFTIGGTSGHRRIKALAIYYASSGGENPSITASNVNIDYNVTSGSIAYSLANATGNVSASVTSGDWLTLGTITASEVPFTCSANTESTARTATVTLSYTGASDKVVTITQTAAPLANLAALVTANDGNYYVALTNALVTYKNGNYAYIQDASAGMYLYGCAGDLAAGDQITGVMNVTYAVYKKLPEVTAFTLVDGYTKTSGNTVTAEEVTLEDLIADYDSYLSRYVVIKGATVQSAFSSKNSTIEQNGNTIIMRDQNSSATLTSTVDDVVDVYCHPAIYNDTKQLSVWEQSQIVVNTVELLDNEITVTGGTEKSIDTNTEYELTLAATATSGEAVIFTVDATSTTLTEGVDFEFVNGNTVGIIQAKAGTIVIKANSAATSEYKAADEVTITITVIGAKQNPTIVVADASVAYGSTFTVDDSVIEGGEITVTSSNEAVATVSGLVITPAAVGTTTITVATAEDATYKAGSETFILTVTAPEGKEDAPSATGEGVTTTFTDKNLHYAEGGVEWTVDNTSAANSFESSGDARGVQFGAAKGEFTLTHENTATITKVALVLSTNGNGNTIAVSVGDEDFETVTGEESVETLTLTSGTKNATFEFTGEAAGNIVISINDVNKSVYVKSITYYVASSSATEEVTLNTSGYATYCSENPLDFNDTSDDTYTAWQLTGIDGTTITFMQITGAIKGGQGILLKKGANNTDADPATIEIPMTDSSEELSSNLLEGTLAPTYKEAGSCYGLSGNTFVKAANAGVVKAGKAFFDASCVSADVKAFTFVFDSADGIQTIEKVSAEEAARIFDLSGRRLSRTQKGVNIVNGKKILVK